MFRIEAFCDDKKLAQLLWALAELGAYNVSSQPVRDHTGAAHNDGKHIASPVDLPPAWAAYVDNHHLQTVSIKDIRAFCATIGYSKYSANHVRKTLLKRRLLSFEPGAPRKGYKVAYRVNKSALDKLAKAATTAESA